MGLICLHSSARPAGGSRGFRPGVDVATGPTGLRGLQWPSGKGCPPVWWSWPCHQVSLRGPSRWARPRLLRLDVTLMPICKGPAST